MSSQTRTGRPIGSTDGRKPAGGYPELTDELGAFLAGFIEGEGSFGIPRQVRRQNHRCAMSLTVRADDLPLLDELRDSTALGTITEQPARASSAPQATWRVAAKADCVRLIEILDRFPLRGCKSRAWAIWRSAAEWWIGGDPCTRTMHRDWEPMVYLKARLSEANSFNAKQIVLSERVEGADGDWPGFVAGFFTAEGTLGITKNNNGLLPRAAVATREDDFPLLLDICDRVGAGRVWREATGPQGRAPAACWSVRDKEGLRRLVEIFDHHRLRGRRAREFAIWREAVCVYASRAPRTAVQSRLGELRARLAGERLQALADSGLPNHS
jgi:hypothetical protein